MSFSKVFFIAVVGLFGFIGAMALVKRGRGSAEFPRETSGLSNEVVAIALHPQERGGEHSLLPGTAVLSGTPDALAHATTAGSLRDPPQAAKESALSNLPVNVSMVQERLLPDADCIGRLFQIGQTEFPFIETVIYSRRVPWFKEGAAWIVDYANYYQTSRHLIGRSLNGGRNYDDQRVSNGDRFNVFKKDYKVRFRLVVDTSRCLMWVYCIDDEAGTKTLLKRYPVGLGRQDPSHPSGLLSPLGTYTLGKNFATFRKESMGIHNGERKELIRVFGTRWIPFGQEVKECSAPATGLGLHGCPWVPVEGDESAGLVEDRSGLGGYKSDGCIRLATDDMEELFSIIITKPTEISIVSDIFSDESQTHPE